MKRPRALIMAGWRNGDLSKVEVELANALGWELGRAFVQNGIDILIGGLFDLSLHIISGAESACEVLGRGLQDVVTTYYTEQYPPRASAKQGQLYRLPDDETYWTRVIMEADAVVAVSGRENTRTVLDLARMLKKPTFAFGILRGAARDVWERRTDAKLDWLGDLGRPPQQLANKVAEEIQRLYAPSWIAGQVFVIMHFADDRAAYEAIAAECKKLNLFAKRADDRPDAAVIVEEIKKLIMESEFIIVDLTHERPNVYYELGYAHGVGNQPSDVLLIANRQAHIHFDIAGLRIHRYDSLDSLQALIRREFALLVENRRRQDD